MKTNQLVIIPFSGFYESVHNMHIDDAIESLCYDRDTDDVNQELLESAYDLINYHAVYKAYAEEYAQALCDNYSLNLTFESLSSPKEYNFTTDRIYCHISQKEVARLYSAVINCGQHILTKVCKDMFTSRDGFTSFYDNDWREYGKVTTWDANQLSALLEAYLIMTVDDDYTKEYELMENARCNGLIENIILNRSPEFVEAINEADNNQHRRATDTPREPVPAINPNQQALFN